MERVLRCVTGAPGAGKSTTVEAILHLQSPFLAFDMDWLTLPASALAGKDVTAEPATWPPYNALWFAVLGMIGATNRQHAVLFSPLAPHDLAHEAIAPWWARVEWLLLDCADDLRRQRLARRPAWTTAMVEEAIGDAAQLREALPTRVDTGSASPQEVALAVLCWLERTG